MLKNYYNKLFYNPLRIKKKNEVFLLKRGARICGWLPYISHTNKSRNSIDIGRRSAIVLAMFHISIGVPTQAIRKWLEENGLLPYLSFGELTILNKNEKELSEGEMRDLGWGIESLCALLWIGSIFNGLSPQEHVPDTLVNFVPDIQNNDSPSKFIEGMKVQPYIQLYKMLDLYYRAHWYARDGFINGENTGDFDLGIIQFRRIALEWAFDPNTDWDEVDLST